MTTQQQSQKQQNYTQQNQAMERSQRDEPTPEQIQIRSHRDFLARQMPIIQKWVTQGVKPEALMRFVMMDIQSNQKLRECSKETIFLGLLACAVTGLEPGALKGEAYLVPFAGKAQFMPGWKGLVKQMRRSGEVSGIVANIVCEHDIFDLDLGTANMVIHKPLKRGDRGEVIGAYSIAKLSNGHHEIEYMDMDDLNRIRAVAEARGKSPAWTTWPEEMQRKSVIRRLAKRLPLGADYIVAMAIEESEDQRRVIDVETDGAASDAMRHAEQAHEISSQAQASLPAGEKKSELPSREPAREERQAVPAQQSEAKPAAEQKAAPTPAKTAPAKPVASAAPAKEAKEAAPEKVKPPEAKPSNSNEEERDCRICGTSVMVPRDAPKGDERCEACANE